MTPVNTVNSRDSYLLYSHVGSIGHDALFVLESCQCRPIDSDVCIPKYNFTRCCLDKFRAVIHVKNNFYYSTHGIYYLYGKLYGDPLQPLSCMRHCTIGMSVCAHVWGVGCSHFHSVWSTWAESECEGGGSSSGRVRGWVKAVIWEGYPTVIGQHMVFTHYYEPGAQGEWYQQKSLHYQSQASIEEDSSAYWRGHHIIL